MLIKRHSDRFTEISLKFRLELGFSKVKIDSQALHLVLTPGVWWEILSWISTSPRALATYRVRKG